LLAHIGYWDGFAADRLSKLLDGRRGEVRPLGDKSRDSRNAELQAQFSGLSFHGAVAILQKERRNFLSVLSRAPDVTLYSRLRLGPGWRPAPYSWVRWRYRHDAGHAAELARWRRTYPPNDPSRRVIHRALLRPLLGLSRQEFTALAALIPPAERETRPVLGAWSLKQIVGHLCDYESLGVVALKAVVAGNEPVYAPAISDFDRFNREREAMWAVLSWEEVWRVFTATRRALLQLAEALPDEALARLFNAPWPAQTTACGYLLDMAQHEREHADGIRSALGLPSLPRRLSWSA
jgi:hypothetical protein